MGVWENPLRPMTFWNKDKPLTEGEKTEKFSRSKIAMRLFYRGKWVIPKKLSRSGFGSTF